jgi:hypothetical protein
MTSHRIELKGLEIGLSADAFGKRGAFGIRGDVKGYASI